MRDLELDYEESYLQKIYRDIIIFGIILCVGSFLAKEMNNQLPRELQINFKKIIIESLIFSLILGGITYIVLGLVL